MTTKFPLLVQFEFHPASTYAVGDGEVPPMCHQRRCGGSRPARIPTYFTPDDYSFMPPEPRLSEEAERVLVVLLADDQLVAHARSGPKGLTWSDYVFRLRQLCDASSNHRFLPVQLTKFAWPIDTRLSDLSFVRAFDEADTAERQKLVARRMVHLLIRRLRPHPTDDDAPPVTIFLSHAKIDVGKPPVS